MTLFSHSKRFTKEHNNKQTKGDVKSMGLGYLLTDFVFPLLNKSRLLPLHCEDWVSVQF